MPEQRQARHETLSGDLAAMDVDRHHPAGAAGNRIRISPYLVGRTDRGMTDRSHARVAIQEGGDATRGFGMALYAQCERFRRLR